MLVGTYLSNEDNRNSCRLDPLLPGDLKIATVGYLAAVSGSLGTGMASTLLETHGRGRRAALRFGHYRCLLPRRCRNCHSRAPESAQRATPDTRHTVRVHLDNCVSAA